MKLLGLMQFVIYKRSVQSSILFPDYPISIPFNRQALQHI